MTSSDVFPGDSDRHFASFPTPLSRKFSVSTMSRLLDLITTEAKMYRSQISSNELPITFLEDLRNISPCTIIPGGKRPNPSLSCLIFVPSRTHILLSKERVEENSVTSGASTVSRPPVMPLPLGGGAFLTFAPPFAAFSCYFIF